MLKFSKKQNSQKVVTAGSYTLEDAIHDYKLSGPFSSGISIKIVTADEVAKTREESKKENSRD